MDAIDVLVYFGVALVFVLVIFLGIKHSQKERRRLDYEEKENLPKP